MPFHVMGIVNRGGILVVRAIVRNTTTFSRKSETFCIKCDAINVSSSQVLVDRDCQCDINDYSALFRIITSEHENISKNNLIMSERYIMKLLFYRDIRFIQIIICNI